MVWTSDESLPVKQLGKTYCFLAGSMDTINPVNWRSIVISEGKNHVEFLDPTNANHDALTDQEMRDHIKWEHDAMELSDLILMNFLPNARSPISLVELGLNARSSKLMVVCPDEFYQKRYVECLCNRFDISFFS